MMSCAKLLQPGRTILRTSVRFVANKCGILIHNLPNSYHQMLKNESKAEIAKLDNGAHVATLKREGPLACVGFFFDSGSAQEDESNNGVAYLFEHLVFQGTGSRTKDEVYSEINTRGARIRTLTTRQFIGYYAECLKEDAKFFVDLISECIYNNKLDRADIDHQKTIIAEELTAIDRNCNKLTKHYLFSTAFQGTPLGMPVTGTSESIKSMTADTIRSYIDKYLQPSRCCLVAVGEVSHGEMSSAAKALKARGGSDKSDGESDGKCGGKSGGGAGDKADEEEIYRYTGSQVMFRDDAMPLCNVAIAVEGPGFSSSDNNALNVAREFVGGWDVRQCGGMEHSNFVAQAASIAHHSVGFKTFNHNLKVGGLWGTQFMAPSIDLEDMMFSIQKQWLRLSTTVQPSDLERAKKQARLRFLKTLQRSRDEMLDIARWVLYAGLRPTVARRLRAIEGVTLPMLQSVCDKYIYNKCPVVSAVGPTEGLPEYNRIRNSMYWLTI